MMKNSSTMKVLRVLFLVLFVVGFVNAQSISGHVTLSTDQSALANFPLKITKTDDPYAGKSILVITDTEGYYYTQVIPGTYTITSVDTQMYEPVVIEGVVVNVAEDVVQDIVVNPRPADAVIAGHVTLEGEAVAGAEVFLFRVLNNSGNTTNSVATDSTFDTSLAQYSAVTDANGDFSMDVIHGSYILYVKGTKDYLPYVSSVLYVAEAETLTLDIQLTPMPFRTISGTVYNFEQFDQVIVTAVSVSAAGVSMTSVNNDGTYNLRVITGKYIVFATGFKDDTPFTIYYDNVLTREEATVLDITSDTTGIDFTFPENLTLSTVTIMGKVTDETDGSPLPGAKVGFLSENIGFMNSNLDSCLHVPVAITDENGNYSFTATTFLDSVSLIGFAKKYGYFIEFYNNQPTFFTATPIVVQAGDTAKGIDFSLSPIPVETTYSISGRVLGEDGNPPPYGAVMAYTTVGIKYAEIDSNGYYMIDGLYEGTTVVLQAWGFPGYIPEFYNDTYSFLDAERLVMNQNYENIDFELKKVDLRSTVGLVKGKITLPNGDAVSGATVYVKRTTDTDWFAAEYSDDNGEFSLPINSYGATYEVKATVPGYTDVETQFTVDENGGTPQSLDLVVNATSIDSDVSNNVIKTNRLYEAYPNPFNPTTTIRVDMARTEKATLTIYNVVGQKVRTLYNGVLKKGVNQFIWDARDDAGNRVASGLYFYQLRTESGIQTKKMMLMK